MDAEVALGSDAQPDAAHRILETLAQLADLVAHHARTRPRAVRLSSSLPRMRLRSASSRSWS